MYSLCILEYCGHRIIINKVFALTNPMGQPGSSFLLLICRFIILFLPVVLIEDPLCLRKEIMEALDGIDQLPASFQVVFSATFLLILYRYAYDHQRPTFMPPGSFDRAGDARYPVLTRPTGRNGLLDFITRPASAHFFLPVISVRPPDFWSCACYRHASSRAVRLGFRNVSFLRVYVVPCLLLLRLPVVVYVFV